MLVPGLLPLNGRAVDHQGDEFSCFRIVAMFGIDLEIVGGPLDELAA